MDGFLLINKPEGMTSHDVCYRLKKMLGIGKIGHTGTLDPMARGVLLIMIGNAARLAEYLVTDDKEYIATIRFGIQTDTQDTSGEVIASAQSDVTMQKLEDAITHFLGKQKQLPPMYSAIKHKGKHLYDYARKGEIIEIPAREIELFDLQILSERLPQEADIRVACSKGTYIRTLCNDIGERLGCHAAMAALTRTAIGTYTIAQSRTPEQIEDMIKQGNIHDALIALDEPIFHFPRIDVKEESERFLLGGNLLMQHNLNTELSEFIPGTRFRIYLHDAFAAVGTLTEELALKPNKVFYSRHNGEGLQK